MEIVGYYLVKQIVIQRMLMPVRKPGEEKYIYQSLGLCYRFLYGQVKERYNEGLFHDFWVTNKTVWIKEYKYSKTMDVVTHISDL